MTVRPAIDSLRRRVDFAQATRGRVVRCGGLRITLHAHPGESCRLGISVPKRTGTAVVRNRLRRRIREAIRTREGGPPHADVHVRVDPEAVLCSFSQLATCLEQAFVGVD